MGNPELEKDLMWISITTTNQCPKCKRNLGNKQEELSKIAIIIICEQCYRRYFYSIFKIFGSYMLHI